MRGFCMFKIFIIKKIHNRGCEKMVVNFYRLIFFVVDYKSPDNTETSLSKMTNPYRLSGSYDD